MSRPDNRWRVFGGAAAWILILAVAGGCGKKTMGPKSTPPPIYSSATSPQNVLQNLVTAYTRRDTVETALVYDIVYQGSSNDPSSPTPTRYFSRADEIRHVGALKLNNNIGSISIDFGPPTSWVRLAPLASDPPEWAIIPIPANTIRIDDVSTATSYESTNTNMEFTFKPTVSAPGDTTWTVVRWTEFAN
jgi:hypothetical protein